MSVAGNGGNGNDLQELEDLSMIMKVEQTTKHPETSRADDKRLKVCLG
jgi:hypothetical protein